MSPVIWACVVCHRPDLEVLRRLVAALEPQVARVLVIDNSPGQPPMTAADLGTAQYVPMDRHAGTAGAIHEAWRLALGAGAQYLLSFDQDSHPGPGLVECLASAFTGTSQPLAAVGPAWIDARTGQPMRLLRPVRFLRRHAPAPAHGL